jgi:hypothetical protein
VEAGERSGCRSSRRVLRSGFGAVAGYVRSDVLVGARAARARFLTAAATAAGFGTPPGRSTREDPRA